MCDSFTRPFLTRIRLNHLRFTTAWIKSGRINTFPFPPNFSKHFVPPISVIRDVLVKAKNQKSKTLVFLIFFALFHLVRWLITLYVPLHSFWLISSLYPLIIGPTHFFTICPDAIALTLCESYVLNLLITFSVSLPSSIPQSTFCVFDDQNGNETHCLALLCHSLLTLPHCIRTGL